MYIRTKDNLYEITDKQYDILCGNLTDKEKENYKNITSFGLGSVEEGTYQSILIKDILEYSENLEDLCDLFYLDRGGDIDINDFYDKYQFDVAKEYYLEEVKHFVPIKLKAYIDTDKGLIYVAKMNENGELELI